MEWMYIVALACSCGNMGLAAEKHNWHSFLGWFSSACWLLVIMLEKTV